MKVKFEEMFKFPWRCSEHGVKYVSNNEKKDQDRSRAYLGTLNNFIFNLFQYIYILDDENNVCISMSSWVFKFLSF